ncbi:uncharacterized protein LOC129725152 [Wyeomyia smithii]|nr:uncharacterized protein LOC129718502 [Wyeomyia smithii]XP_055536615.1 uncharacterized protein LOC129725152 [Wyeomyia smithii]
MCMKNLEINQIECVRCGAHTLNLVVADATKIAEAELKAVTKIVKAYRKAEYQTSFKYSGVAMPPIPNQIRWNHYFLMLRELIKNREFFAGLGVKHPMLDLSGSWKVVDDYHEAFAPLYDATIAAQKNDCVISQFHLEWLKAYGRVMKLGDNRFRTPILQSMQKRQKTLMSSMPYKAALFMDPRLNFNGSELFLNPEKQKIVVNTYLFKTSAIR